MGGSHSRSSNYRVCDGGCAYTWYRTHIFLHYTVHTPHFSWLRTHAHGSRSHKKVFEVCMSCLSISLSILISHLSSLLFSDNRLTFRDLLPGDPKARVQRTSTPVRRNLSTWQIPRTPQVMNTKQPDKTTSVKGDTTPINDPDHDSISDFSKTHTREHWTARCSHSVWTLCFVDFSRWFCSSEREQRKPDSGKPSASWGCGDRDGSVISVGESILKRSRRNSTRSHSPSDLPRILF